MAGYRAIRGHARYLLSVESTERQPNSSRRPTAGCLRCSRLFPCRPPSRPRNRNRDGSRVRVRVMGGRCWIEGCSISSSVRSKCKPTATTAQHSSLYCLYLYLYLYLHPLLILMRILSACVLCFNRIVMCVCVGEDGCAVSHGCATISLREGSCYCSQLRQHHPNTQERLHHCARTGRVRIRIRVRVRHIGCEGERERKASGGHVVALRDRP